MERMVSVELCDRKQKILSAIVELYIPSGEPVGSKTLASLLNNTVSSATIRNEMAELCAMGYLEQPHTSAGRVPTSKAFRLYIDKLMRRRNLSKEDRLLIDDMLVHAAGDPERLIAEASQALAETTGCAAITTTPSGRSANVKRVEVMRVSSCSAAIILMTDSGLLKSRICRFECEQMRSDVLETLSHELNKCFSGKPLNSIGMPQVQSMAVSLGEHGLLCAPALTSFYLLIKEAGETEVSLTGQLNILRHPDYDNVRARDLLAFLARRELLSGMLTAMPGGLRVVIGSESSRPELDGSSIIATRYKLGGQPDGSIGIIGPLRMDYAKAIPSIEYLAVAVGKILDEIMGADEYKQNNIKNPNFKGRNECEQDTDS